MSQNTEKATDPLTDREMAAFRDDPRPSVARLVEAIDANRTRAEDFYRLVEGREAGWVRAFRCRQNRMKALVLLLQIARYYILPYCNSRVPAGSQREARRLVEDIDAEVGAPKEGE